VIVFFLFIGMYESQIVCFSRFSNVQLERFSQINHNVGTLILKTTFIECYESSIYLPSNILACLLLSNPEIIKMYVSADLA
jgi:hypothetical protein